MPRFFAPRLRRQYRFPSQLMLHKTVCRRMIRRADSSQGGFARMCQGRFVRVATVVAVFAVFLSLPGCNKSGPAKSAATSSAANPAHSGWLARSRGSARRFVGAGRSDRRAAHDARRYHAPAVCRKSPADRRELPPRVCRARLLRSDHLSPCRAGPNAYRRRLHGRAGQKSRLGHRSIMNRAMASRTAAAPLP